MPAIDVESYHHLELVKNGAVLTATISNPGKKNAVTLGILDDLGRIWRDVDRDEDLRVVVLTGKGDTFCSGADLGVLADRDVARHRLKGIARGARERIFDILDCETPVIAKVRGPAYGIGVNLALACDFVVAADDARFCDSHVRTGITAGDGGVALIPLLVGFRRAKEMLMLSEPVTGSEAVEIGLINRAVPGAELDAAVDDLVARIVAGPPLALAWTKLALNALMKQMSLGAFETSIAYDMLSLRTDDVKEGARAFLEKRPPDFTGG